MLNEHNWTKSNFWTFYLRDKFSRTFGKIINYLLLLPAVHCFSYKHLTRAMINHLTAKLISTTDLLVHWKNNQTEGVPCTHECVNVSPKISGLWKHSFMPLSYLELRIVLEYQISNQYSNFYDCAIDAYGENLDHLKVPALPVVT